MTDESDPDWDVRPADAHRHGERLNGSRSLPGPNPSRLPPALAPPAPTISEQAPTAVSSVEIETSSARLYLTVHLPGTPNDAIEVRAWERRFAVHAIRPGGSNCDLDLELPVRVDSRTVAWSCRNGVLDLIFRRSLDDASRGELDG